jgi:hypothetical protein
LIFECLAGEENNGCKEASRKFIAGVTQSINQSKLHILTSKKRPTMESEEHVLYRVAVPVLCIIFTIFVVAVLVVSTLHFEDVTMVTLIAAVLMFVSGAILLATLMRK